MKFSIIESIDNNDNNLIIYPSPAIEKISISDDLILLNIYNLQGKRVMQVKEYAKGESINIMGLSSGTYVVEGMSNSKTIKKGKFLK